MELIFDGEIEYQRLHDRANRNATTCDLSVYRDENWNALVIATEIHSNHGFSITNSSEDLATVVVQRFNLDPAKTTFVEHYNAFSYSEKPSAMAVKQHPDTYATVTYTWEGLRASKPVWSKWIGQEAFEETVLNKTTLTDGQS